MSNSPTMMASMPGDDCSGRRHTWRRSRLAAQPVDKRADIWAFGVVFYEMLTGRRAFDGEDVSSILAAVLQSAAALGWRARQPAARARKLSREGSAKSTARYRRRLEAGR